MWIKQISVVVGCVNQIKDSRRRLYDSLTYASLLLSLSIGLVSCDSETLNNTETPDNSSSPITTRRTVTILGAITGEQQQKLEAALTPFVEETGIEVVYQGTEAFSNLLPVRVEAGNAPDIVMFPQPGLMANFARKGLLVPLETVIDSAQLKQAYSQDWLKLGSVNGTLYGIWYRASVKSLVWYNPKAFNSAGYQVPTTWDEMEDLSEQIVADGRVPWCLGIESGDATGWVGTDWIEDIMLRTAGPQAYDQWARHEIPFNSAVVKQAFQQFGRIALNPKYVVGGTVGVMSTPFGISANGLLTDPPQCYLHRQASFISNFFPQGVVLGVNVDVFPLPPINPEFGLPILVGGDVVGMFNDTPEARKLIQYLTTVQPHEISVQLGGYISPHQGVSLTSYPDPVSRKQAEILFNADVIRFDASDLMPATVGTGKFWMGVVNYIEGEDLDQVLIEIDQGWPKP